MLLVRFVCNSGIACAVNLRMISISWYVIRLLMSSTKGQILENLFIVKCSLQWIYKHGLQPLDSIIQYSCDSSPRVETGRQTDQTERRDQVVVSSSVWILPRHLWPNIQKHRFGCCCGKGQVIRKFTNSHHLNSYARLPAVLSERQVGLHGTINGDHRHFRIIFPVHSRCWTIEMKLRQIIPGQVLNSDQLHYIAWRPQQQDNGPPTIHVSPQIEASEHPYERKTSGKDFAQPVGLSFRYRQSPPAPCNERPWNSCGKQLSWSSFQDSNGALRIPVENSLSFHSQWIMFRNSALFSSSFSFCFLTFPCSPGQASIILTDHLLPNVEQIVNRCLHDPVSPFNHYTLPQSLITLSFLSVSQERAGSRKHTLNAIGNACARVILQFGYAPEEE